MPVNTMGGLSGVNWYNDAYSFTTGGFASAVPTGANYVVYGYAASLTPTVTGSLTNTYDTTLAAGTVSLTAGLINANGLTDAAPSLAYTTAAYDNPNAASGHTVTVSGISLSSNPDNYILGSTTATSTAEMVTPAPLTITADNQSKVFGTVASLGTTAFTDTGLLSGNGDAISGVTLTSAGTAATASVAASP